MGIAAPLIHALLDAPKAKHMTTCCIQYTTTERTFEILRNSDGTYWKKKLRGCLRKTTGLYSQSLHPFQQYSSPRYFSQSLPLHHADKIEEFIVCHYIPYDIENVRSCLKHAIP